MHKHNKLCDMRIEEEKEHAWTVTNKFVGLWVNTWKLCSLLIHIVFSRRLIGTSCNCTSQKACANSQQKKNSSNAAGRAFCIEKSCSLHWRQITVKCFGRQWSSPKAALTFDVSLCTFIKGLLSRITWHLMPSYAGEPFLRVRARCEHLPPLRFLTKDPTLGNRTHWNARLDFQGRGLPVGAQNTAYRREGTKTTYTWMCLTQWADSE